MKTLTQAIRALCDGAPTTLPGGERITEMPLLDQLADAKTARRWGGAGGGGASSPINLDAAQIEQDIDAEVNRVCSHHMRAADRKTRVKYWASNTPGLHALAEALEWCDRIRALSHIKVPLEGVCPMCGAEQVFRYNSEGERVVTPALTITLDGPRLTIACGADGCGHAAHGITGLENLNSETKTAIMSLAGTTVP